MVGFCDRFTEGCLGSIGLLIALLFCALLSSFSLVFLLSHSVDFRMAQVYSKASHKNTRK